MSNGPQNFRNMKFPVSRNGTNAVYAPLPPAPPPRSITQTEQEKRSLQLKEMKAFANNQKCPICQAQLEGQVAFDKASLFCCANEKEYRVIFKFGIEKPVWSCITYFHTNFAFEVINKLLVEDELYENVIYKIDLSYNERYQQINKVELLRYEGAPLHFKSDLTEEQLLDKIKLYTLFS